MQIRTLSKRAKIAIATVAMIGILGGTSLLAPTFTHTTSPSPTPTPCFHFPGIYHHPRNISICIDSQIITPTPIQP